MSLLAVETVYGVSLVVPGLFVVYALWRFWVHWGDGLEHQHPSLSKWLAIKVVLILLLACMNCWSAVEDLPTDDYEREGC